MTPRMTRTPNPLNLSWQSRILSATLAIATLWLLCLIKTVDATFAWTGTALILVAAFLMWVIPMALSRKGDGT